ncbi:redoxin domain-containing protein [Bernardetia sp. ABR2-2B]|uniref:redoxin domain-containing protein n=1 Tax=Bernardetia sp. ABR2-2B TaxID=3127472 RepID=UPI0030D54024
MKNIFVFICILFLTPFSASKVFAQDSTSIKITLPNSEKWSTDSVKIYNFLHDKWTYFDKIDTTTNSCFLKFPCERAIEQEIYLGKNKGFYLLIQPDDTIEIVIDEEGKPNFMKGKASREHQITYNKIEDYDYSSMKVWLLVDGSELNIEESFYKTDSLNKKILADYEIAIKYFKVDSVFDTYFRNEIDAQQDSDYDAILYDIENKMDEIPSYYDKYKPNIKNQIDDNYPYSKNYINLLYEQILEENCVETKREIRTDKYYTCAYKRVKEIKNEKIRNYLILKIFDGILYITDWWSEEEKLVNEMIEEVKKAFPNSEKVKIIEEKAALFKRLAEHLPEPNFTLKDQNGKKVSLSDFRGKYVFITFIDSAAQNLEVNSWYAKLLYEKYTDERITFLYIFVNDSETAWRNIIATQETEGIHLFANEEQSKELFDSYSKQVYKIKSSNNFQMSRYGIDTQNYQVVFINKEGYSISNSLYLGHNMDWVAKKILNGK